MSRPSPKPNARRRGSTQGPLLAVLVVAVVVIGALAFLLGGPTAGPEEAEVVAGDASALGDPASGAGRVGVADIVPPPRVPVFDWDEPTTVLWPARVELDLLRADYLPEDPGVDPIGSGRTARLSGRLARSADGGIQGEVRFVAGPNEGRVLSCDVTGAFGATDLYPGLAIVEVSGPGILGAKREVRLRQGKETLLNLGFGLPGSVHGKVVDRSGEPVQNARVVFDGQTTYTDVEGSFYLAQVASGHCLVEVEHDDFASYLQLVAVTAGKVIPPGRLTMTLHPKTSMQLTLPSAVGGPGPALVYLIPSSNARTRGVGPGISVRRYPWHRLNPIELQPNSALLVENLPTEVVKVMAFRPGATAREQVVNLREGRVTPVTIDLKPAPKVSGIVRVDGRPQPGVVVTLEAPDRVRANLGFLREPSTYLETEVMPYFPPARQEVVTNHEGRFSMTAWAEVAGVRYLEARDASGAWAGRLVRPGEEQVDLDLADVELGDSALALEFPDRFQALPIEIVVNGNPQDPDDLPPHAELEIDSLVAGTWSLRVSWHGQEIYSDPELRLDGRTGVRVDLPLEAREGQDEEQWKRAGRTWPVQ